MKERRKEYNKNYLQKNEKKLKQYNKEYRENNKEKIRKYHQRPEVKERKRNCTKQNRKKP